MNYLKYTLLTVFLAFCLGVSAGTIKGKVTDSKTKEPLIGATVTLIGSSKKLTTSVNLDGTYIFRNVPVGSYKIKINFAGYKSSDDLVAEIKSVNDLVIAGTELKEEVTDLAEVQVKSEYSKESDNSVRAIERTGNVVQNILSAKAIELSPDVTVANSLQRMSGVSLQSSSSGEGKYAIIRGMDQRYNTTLVNGIKIPSPDDRYRYVPMNLFPSDILERLEVIKALTPNMEGDAVGGVMNLVMKNAPNKEEFKVFAAGGNALLFSDRPFSTFDHSSINKKSPYETTNGGNAIDSSSFPKNNLRIKNQSMPLNFQTGLTYGNRFFHKKLGFLVSLSYQNMYRGTNQSVIRQYPGAILVPNANGKIGNTIENYPQFNDVLINQISIQQKRFALNNKWDYIFNSRNKISLYNLYVRMDEFQTRLSSDTDINTNPGNLVINKRTSWQIQSIYNSTLHGEHKISTALNLDWSAAYSRAKQEFPDLAQYNVDNKLWNRFSSDSLIYNHDSALVKSMSRSWSHNTDQDISAYVNLTWLKKICHRNMEFGFGGMFRHKIRDNFYRTYTLSSSNSNSPQLINIDSIKYSFNTAVGDVPSGDPGVARNYSITENVSAAYLQAKFMATDKLQILGGIRFENTDQSYSTDLTPYLNAKTGKINYYDILPSLHFRYTIDRLRSIRASYFRSLIRPGFVEITPSYTPATETEAYDQQGNPKLKHTTADNYDVRFELFHKAADQLLVGAFYKRIYNPIEVTFSHYKVTGGNSSPGDNILTPTNIGNVNNYGIELLYTKYFGKFGISANYTYTHSATTTTKFYLAYDTTKRSTKTDSVSQTRPLQGQAEHIGNISLLFKDHKLGLDIQLAYVYTGERIQLVNTFYNLDTWQAPYNQLDLSFTKKIVKRLEIYGKVNNLTNEKTKFYIKQPFILDKGHPLPFQDESKHIFVRRDVFKTSYSLGLRFKI